ncbi:unnamed protein product [Nippostrongylus brasiliensis]|uniref:Carboxylic ester hydrolase n=1 Tax=Nippostrongylus brasiliensis TaxID=27835 RepID=A0A0N4YFH3_NIPBR|nr:unnamed protein product [Nippostrongylus brasiliensis]
MPLAVLVGLLLLVQLISTSDGDPIVKTIHSDLRGLYMDVEGNRVSAFLGVPFAMPPTGSRRFTKPTPITDYQGEIKAQTLSKTCFQTPDSAFPGFPGAEMWNAPTELSEDCLYLNIWAPENPTGNVIVWIYGGGFFSGSPSLALYNGSVLAAKTRSIIVNINYRLGPFGFFYLGEDSSAPGNVGLLDQQLALQWVHDNIKYFGGDAKRVTLFGESAGAASVSSHLLAPDSGHLFSKAILNSGSMLNIWADRTPCKQLNFSLTMAKNLGCIDHFEMKPKRKPGRCIAKGVDDQKVFKCLNNIPTAKIQGDFRNKLSNGNFKKNAPIFIGTVKDEGTYWLPYYLSNTGFSFDPSKGADSPENAALINEYRDGVAKFVNDFFFTCDVMNFVDELMWSSTAPVYMYFLTARQQFRSSANPWPKWMGAMHGYDIEYEFGQPFFNASLYHVRAHFEPLYMKWPTYDDVSAKTLIIDENVAKGKYYVKRKLHKKYCRIIAKAMKAAGKGDTLS